MDIVLKPSSPCPCGSGAEVVNCCGKTGSIIRPGVATEPPRPVTGYSHPGCFANNLGDCSDKLSREHIISNTILEAIGDQITVGGFTWLGDEVKSLPRSALTARILCERHNNALSDVDTRAGQLFKEMQEAEAFIRKNNGEVRLRLFNGHDLEKWLLKVVCGISVAKVADHKAGDAGIHALAYWVEVLFGRRPLPKGHGLYVRAPLGHEEQAINGISVALISNPEDGIYGMILHFRDKILLLPLKLPSGPIPENSLLQNTLYRPREFLFKRQQTKVSILFTWDRDFDSRGIVWGYPEKHN